MATLHEMQRRLKTVDLKQIAIGIVADTKPDLIDKNREQLMDEGTDRRNKKLQRYRSNSYAARKNKMNPFPGFGNPDLYRTGAFQRAFQFKLLSKDTFEIYSTDSKAKDLEKKYGTDIFGLTDQSKSEYNKTIMQPQMVQEVKKILKI